MAARSGQGTTTKISISSVMTLIPGMTFAPFLIPPQKREDVSTLDSPSGFPEELIVGKDFVEDSGELIYDTENAVHEYLMQATLAGTIEAFEVQPIGATKKLTFSATLSLKPNIGVHKAQRANLTIRLTGEPTWAA